MDNQALIRTALIDTPAVESDHTLAEHPLCGKLNLRGNSADPAFIGAVEQVLGLALPLIPNTLTSAAKKIVFWLGPDEWLLHLPLEEATEMLEALHAALENQHHAVTDVSDYYSVIHLSGPQVRDVIASGSPLDIRPDRFSAGDCAQTRFGHASILIWPVEETPAYGLQVRWSFAQYLFDYLAQSIHNTESLASFDISGSA